jgi:tripartite-type tricarboxylate transporter receptor subunit TctC
VHVPYQGFPQVTNAIVGQQINTAFMAPSGALAQAKAGKVRILGISSPERSPLAPDVPTIAESGLPGFQAELWIAAFAANNLPPVAAARLTREINALLQRADVKEKFLQQGWKAMGTSGEDMARRIQQDTTVWSQVIRDAGIKPE